MGYTYLRDPGKDHNSACCHDCKHTGEAWEFDAPLVKPLKGSENMTDEEITRWWEDFSAGRIKINIVPGTAFVNENAPRIKFTKGVDDVPDIVDASKSSPAPRTEEEIQKAIRLLMEVTHDGLVVIDATGESVLVPAILDNGTLEYQVSDGLPGHRSRSFDFYTFKEAWDAHVGANTFGFREFFTNKEGGDARGT